MIWHILKKDLRLLWRLVIAVAAIDWLNAGLLIYGGPFGRESAAEFALISNGVLPAISLLGLALLAIAVVQQDRLPGTTQDWLTRPVPHNQLVLAKLSFVATDGAWPDLRRRRFDGLCRASARDRRSRGQLDARLRICGVIGLPACSWAASLDRLRSAVLPP